MIELCENCNFTVLIADLIGTLLSLDKDEKLFILKIYYNNWEIPLKFDNECHFDFLQEGIRIESDYKITYLFYDTVNSFEVVKL